MPVVLYDFHQMIPFSLLADYAVAEVHWYIYAFIAICTSTCLFNV
jgi:hypothetical protein